MMDSIDGSVGVNNLRHSIYFGVLWNSVGLLLVFGASNIILWIELVYSKVLLCDGNSCYSAASTMYLFGRLSRRV